MANTKSILNKSELSVFNEIEETLKNSGLYVIPQQPLRSVIDIDNLLLSKKEKETAKHAVFDFVITDKKTTPLFAIEFDGPDHFKYGKTHEADLRKISICDKADLPLLRICYQLYDKFQQSKIVSFVVYRYLKWILEKEQFEKDFQEKVDYEVSSGQTFEEIYDNLYVSQPEIEFNYKYYFPGIYNIEKQLYDRYKLYPEDLNLFDKSHFLSKYSITHLASPETQNGIVKAYSKLKVTGKYCQGNNEISYEKEITGDEIQIQWLYNIRYNKDDKTNPLRESDRSDYIRCVSNGIPGTQLIDLCEMLAEFDCLTKVFNDIEKLNKVFINPYDENVDLYYSRQKEIN